MMARARTFLLVAGIVLPACSNAPVLAPETAESRSIGAGVARLNREAQAVQPLAKSGWSAEFLASTARLPPVSPRKVNGERVDETGYYFGDGDSPAFFVRLLDILAEGETRKLVGRRFLQLDYASIGALRMLAAGGATVAAVSPSSRLRTLYSLPGDQGDVALFAREVGGSVRLFSGDYPADPATRAAIGGGYDAVIAKNVFKRGYIHPAEPVSPDTQKRLGMSDEEFVTTLLGLLRPGGRLLVYNICPPQGSSGQAYSPHADCRNPFPQSLWQAMGFRVRDYDRNDTAVAREFGQVLGWDGSLLATYTLVERP